MFLEIGLEKNQRHMLAKYLCQRMYIVQGASNFNVWDGRTTR